MHDLRIARTKFDRVHVAVRAQPQRDDEAAVKIGTFDRYRKRLRHPHGQIRMRQPGLARSRHGRQIGGVSLRRAVAGPAPDGVDLGLGQAARALEIPMAWLRLPGRHVAAGRHLGDERRPLGGVRIAHQRKGRDFTGAVAGNALPVEDRRDIAGEGGRRSRAARLPQPGQEYQCAHNSSIA